MSVIAASPNPLSRLTKIAYGIGDTGPAIVAAVNGFFLNAFLIEVAGLRPATVALIFLLVKIWDSVNDPIVGALTDRTNTRWGRRRPWLLFGAVPFGLAFFLQWQVPALSDTGLFWYYLAVALLLDTGFTAVNVPYAAMTPELTRDYDERTTLNSYRFSFSILGGLFAAFFHTLIVAGYADRGAILTGYLVSAGIWAAVIVVTNLITFAFTRENAAALSDEPELGFLEGLRVAFANRPFVLVTVIYLLSWLAIQFVQNNLILFVNYWSGGADVFQFMLLLLQGMAFVFLLFWSRVSQRLGKQRVYYLGVSFWMVASVAMMFVPRGGYVWLFPIALVASAGVSVCYLIPWSMLPDVVDLDELETGKRREGIFYGFFVFLQKLGISLGIAFSNLVLDWAGYLKPAYAGAPLVQDQPAAVLLALRAFVSLAPILILTAGILAVRRYPISRERHGRILAALAARRAGDAPPAATP